MENFVRTRPGSRVATGNGRAGIRRTYPYLAYDESAQGTQSKRSKFPLHREFSPRLKPVTRANGLVGALTGTAIALFLSLNAASTQSWSMTLFLGIVVLLVVGTLTGSVLGIVIGAVLGRLYSNKAAGQLQAHIDGSDAVRTLHKAPPRPGKVEQDATHSNLG